MHPIACPRNSNLNEANATFVAVQKTERATQPRPSLYQVQAAGKIFRGADTKALLKLAVAAKRAQRGQDPQVVFFRQD